MREYERTLRGCPKKPKQFFLRVLHDTSAIESKQGREEKPMPDRLIRVATREANKRAR